MAKKKANGRDRIPRSVVADAMVEVLFDLKIPGCVVVVDRGRNCGILTVTGAAGLNLERWECRFRWDLVEKALAESGPAFLARVRQIVENSGYEGLGEEAT